MTKLLIVCVALVACGCKITCGSYNPQTGKVRVIDARLGMNTKAKITANVSTNGMTIGADATSSPDEKAIEAVSKGATQAALEYFSGKK